MDPKINIITLGVSNLARALHFYRDGLGWPVSSAGNEHIAFLRTGGVVLALYSRMSLAEDVTVDPDGHGFRGLTIAHNVAQREQVDSVLAEAVVAGATIVKPAVDAFWGGRSGYFADPDGHLWEVAWNPHFPLKEDGSIDLPV